MPYKCEKINIAGTEHDRRIKLFPEDKKIIRQLRKQGWSQRELAREFGVSRRLIQFIIDPKKKERDLELREQRGGSKAYYDKDKHRDYMKSHRHYKQDLYVKGEINLDG